MGVRNLILTSRSDVEWVSCKVIGDNLISAYKEAFNPSEIEFLKIEKSPDNGSYLFIAEEIQKLNPERVVFLEYQPHPLKLLRCFHYLGYRPPEVIFHVYGDFSLFMRDWVYCEKYLKGINTKFICASHRQKGFISDLLDGDYTHCIAFPGDSNHYQIDQQAREGFRRKYSLQDNEIAVVYAGRISIQKNVIGALTELIKTSKELKLPVKFFVAGPCDDIGLPYLGHFSPNGQMLSTWGEFLYKVEEENPGLVRYLGSLDKDGLKELFNGGDIGFSMSTHNDEDFGMAPAESLLCGLPNILSDWGGYSSFGLNPLCSLIPIKIEDGIFGFDKNSLRKEFLKLTMRPLTLEKRQELSCDFKNYLGINQVGKKIKDCLNLPKGNQFKGLSQFGKILGNVEENDLIFAKQIIDISAVSNFPSLEIERKYNEFYFKVYDAYFRDFSKLSE